MTQEKLCCYAASDLTDWERRALENLVLQLGKTRRVEIGPLENKKIEAKEGERYWIWTRNLEKARGLIRGAAIKCPVFISVFGLPGRTALPKLFWRKNPVSSDINLITHSVLNQKFYQDVVGVEESKVHFLPLSIRCSETVAKKPEADAEFVLGTFCDFNVDANLHFLSSIGHLLSKKNRRFSLRILGSGELRRHAGNLISDLGLSGQVHVIESHSIDDIRQLDAFIYTPSLNDHYLPLLIAAELGIPVLSTDILGVRDYFPESAKNFVVPPHATVPAVEALELLCEPSYRKAIGKAMQSFVRERYTADRLSPIYESLLFKLKERDNKSAAA